jgi:DNA/RNA endonuclease G (NUC1)
MLRIAAFGLALVACNSDRVVGPSPLLRAPAGLQADGIGIQSVSGVVVSQVYGGGGNANAQYKNDFIELFNAGSSPVTLTGWSVQYASTVGSSWAATALTGTLQPGHYYLVQEAAGTGTVPLLPTPDATGSIAMAAGAGKVALVNTTTLLTGSGCPMAASVVDFVGYGSGTNCFEGSGPTLPSLTNTTAAIRKSGGQQDTNDNPADFANGAPTPRNTTSPPPSGVVVTISPNAPSVVAGTTVNFTVTATQNSSNVPITSATWTSATPSVATIDATTGVATTLSAGTSTIGVSVTTASGNGSSSTLLTVTSGAVVSSITVTPGSATITQGGTQQFSAQAYDASNNPMSGVTFTWGTSNSAVATVNSSGLATGMGVGDANITATSGSAVGTGALHVNPNTYIPPDIRFSEIHYDNTGTDAGEAVEIEGPNGTSLAGWTVLFYNGDPASTTSPLKVYNTVAVTGALSAPISCGGRGALSIPIPVTPGIQNGGTAGGQPDGFALVDNNGVLVEFLSYEGSFTAADGAANGVTSRNIVAMEDNPVPAPDMSLHRSADGMTWSNASGADFGYVNACGGPPPSSITFSGRSPTADPPLLVGFESQIFASETVGGSPVSTTFTWISETPAIASIEQTTGVIRALAAGSATFRATATDGATATYALPTLVGTQSSAPYGGNTEFGDPVDADPSNDYIIRRLEYTSSWNGPLGRPNWVSEKLDATAYGAEDRANSFTFDPLLEAAGFTKYTTNDYTGAGAFAGYGIDRGHMTRSADRTASNLDNARTFYFSNVLPQAAAVNQGPWAIMENYLGDFAKNQGKEVYVVEGGSSGPGFPSKGFIKGQNKIEMPGATWKVVLIMDHGKGLGDVHSVADLQAVAVIMPNDPAVNSDWTTYKTTIDAVEAFSGYDFFSLLPDNIENAIESNDTPPVAAISGATSGAEGASLSFSASGSSDADAGDALTYAWTFGDGGTATGLNVTHAFPDNGTYTVTVTVTDSHGVYDTKSMTVTTTNVAPVITGFSTPAGSKTGAQVTVSFSDAGSADTHTALINWGDGQTSTVNAGLATSASATHAYANVGWYSVSATVTDDDGASVSTATQTLVVYDAAAGYTTARGYIQGVMINQKTYFSHDVRYTGGSTPTGTFEIHGSAAANLTSNALEYLVVQGTTGTFKGTGTLTNGTPVTFLVRGIDNKPGQTNKDKIRIKVWNSATNAVIYDSQPNAAELATPTANVVAGSYNILH